MPRSSRSDSRPEPGFTRNVSTTGGPAARIAARRLTRCRPPAIQSSLPSEKKPARSGVNRGAELLEPLGFKEVALVWPFIGLGSSILQSGPPRARRREVHLARPVELLGWVRLLPYSFTFRAGGPVRARAPWRHDVR